MILNSLTFRYTRQPKDLCLAPERLTGRDLRISEKIKLLNQSAIDPNNEEKFFVALTEDLIDPNRERNVASKVSSIM